MLYGSGVSESAARSHRLYQLEVIQLSHDVSFIIVVPPIDDVTSHHVTTPDTLVAKVPLQTVPVQVFEICKFYVHVSYHQIAS